MKNGNAIFSILVNCRVRPALFLLLAFFQMEDIPFDEPVKTIARTVKIQKQQ
jgi:hypothetical protein